MKYFERESENTKYVKPYQSFLVRLDGKNFSSKTTNLVKPFDKVFTEAMLYTARDLLEEYHGSTVFVQSDEITILFRPLMTKEEYKNGLNNSTHLFGGRVQKLLSILAGFTSTRFTINFANQLNKSALTEIDENIKNTHIEYLNKINGNGLLERASFCFDARLIIFPINRSFEVVNNILWRSVHDGYRNFVSGLCYYHLSKKSLEGINTTERALLLKSQKNILVEDQPSHLRYGWYLKTLSKEVNCENGVTTRNFTVAKSFKIKYTQQIEKMLFDKYWNGVEESISFEESREL